jgi:hypothetical protein
MFKDFFVWLAYRKQATLTKLRVYWLIIIFTFIVNTYKQIYCKTFLWYFCSTHTVSKWRVSIFKLESIVVVWWLDLQLPVQSVPITTTVCEYESRSWRGLLDTTLCNKVCQWLAICMWFSPGTPVSSTDITEILFKVTFNTINQSTNIS